jgi:predicted nuclease of predicted toxin-antitoxin system
MSKIRLYLDEDTLRKTFVQALRENGIDVVTVSDANNLGRIDEEQLIWATEQGRVIYTFNSRDFCRLHGSFIAVGNNHAGIIVVPRQSYSVGEQLRGLLNLIGSKSAEGMMNQLEFLGTYIRSE